MEDVLINILNSAGSKKKLKVKKKEKFTPPVLRHKTLQSYTKVTIFFFLKRLGVDSCRTNSVKRLKGFQELSMTKAKPKDWTLETLMTRLRSYFSSIFFNGRLENTG